ncbi:unnamed protein product [Alopecurus aequalis]
MGDAKCPPDVHDTYFMDGAAAITGIMATVLLLSGLFQFVLRRLGQPSIISHILAGLMVGPTVLGRAVDLHNVGIEDAGTGLAKTIYPLCILFMLFLGLEIDLRYLRHNMRRSLLLACGGSVISLLLAFLGGASSYGLLHPDTDPVQVASEAARLYSYMALFMIVLTSTASPVLIRIVTELKLTASETGQMAIGAAFATDIVCLTTLSFLPAVLAKDRGNCLPGEPEMRLVWMALIMLVAVALAVGVARLINWAKPGRRYISNYELGAMLLFIVGMCVQVHWLGYSGSMTALLVGLAMPRDGPMARTLMDRLTYPVQQIIVPLCFATISAKLNLADVGVLTAARISASVVFTTVLSAAGKVLGTMLVGRWLGITQREAVLLGFLLNVKGYSDILALNLGEQTGVLDDTSQMVLLGSSILSTFMAGPASAMIVRQQRRGFQYRSHCLQDLSVDRELRVLACVHGAAGVDAMLTLAELSRGSGAPVQTVYLLHLVELMASRKYAITHLYKDVDARVKVKSRGDEEDQWGYVREMDQVAAAVHGFTIYHAALPVRHMTAISNLATMDVDVCNGVEDARATLLLVPYHKERRYDGRMVSRRDGLWQLNRRILQRAPCTVGVLLERPSISVVAPVAGADDEEQRTSSQDADREEAAPTPKVHHVVALFLGGPDDREAVAYATRLAAHPLVSVSVSRFRLSQPALDDNVNLQTTTETGGEDEEKEDEEFMAEVYAGFVEPGRVSYMETVVSNKVEMLNALSAMIGMSSLLVVGKGSGGATSAWTAMTRCLGGLDEEEELGPVGNLLVSDDFLGCSSAVLVIQQHKLYQKMSRWKRHSHGPLPDHHILTV